MNVEAIPRLLAQIVSELPELHIQYGREIVLLSYIYCRSPLRQKFTFLIVHVYWSIAPLPPEIYKCVKNIHKFPNRTPVKSVH